MYNYVFYLLKLNLICLKKFISKIFLNKALQKNKIATKYNPPFAKIYRKITSRFRKKNVIKPIN